MNTAATISPVLALQLSGTTRTALITRRLVPTR